MTSAVTPPRPGFRWRLDEADGAMLAEGECPCGVTSRVVVTAAELAGAGPPAGLDAQATLMRRVERAMEAEGCTHAWHDLRWVTPCLFRPTRPRREAALAAVEGVARGDEAWEVLASRALVPFEWVGDEARRFVDAAGALQPAPPDARSAAALAADPDGVLRAEAMAWELAARLRTFGLPRPARVAWRVADPSFWRPARGRYLTDALASLAAERLRLAAPGAGAAFWWDLARSDVESADAWAAAARAGVYLPGESNAFEPLAALWMTGYALDAATADALTLVAAPA